MSVFSTNVALMGPDFRVCSFSPGDTVPDWAVGLVGDHCLMDAPAKGSKPVVARSEPAEDVPVVAGVPDFTKPAPAKRGRPRKDA